MTFMMFAMTYFDNDAKGRNDGYTNLFLCRNILNEAQFIALARHIASDDYSHLACPDCEGTIVENYSGLPLAARK